MATEPNVLAVDLGTGGPKVALVSTSGRVIDRESEATRTLFRPGGGVEQNPEEWWSATVAATRRLLGRAGRTARPEAVAVTGQWSGTVPVDRHGRALANALTWMDARGAPHARRVAGGPVRVGGYGLGRLARWLRTTGGAPSLSGRDPLGHILFLKHERPDVYESATAFLEPVDYLTMRMTGQVATSAVTSTVHWLSDTREHAAPGYDRRLVRASTIDPSKLPPVHPTGSLAGRLDRLAADELGLPSGLPVPAGTPDIMSAAIGSGAVAEHQAHLYVGTSSWLACHTSERRVDARHSLTSLPSAIPGRYLVVDEQQTAGASVDMLLRTLLPDSGDEGYGELERLAAQAPPGSGGLLVTPWLNGERTPVDDHRLRGSIINLSLETTRADLARATLEGVALNARWMQQYVERLVGEPLDPISFIGGGAQSEGWCQIMADVLGRRVDRVEDPVDANVRGAAFLAGVATGAMSFEDVPGRVRVEASFAPDPANREVYDRLFDELRSTYRATRDICRRLNAEGGGRARNGHGGIVSRIRGYA